LLKSYLAAIEQVGQPQGELREDHQQGSHKKYGYQEGQDTKGDGYYVMLGNNALEDKQTDTKGGCD